MSAIDYFTVISKDHRGCSKEWNKVQLISAGNGSVAFLDEKGKKIIICGGVIVVKQE